MKVAYVIPSMAGAGGAGRSLAAMIPFLTRHIDLHVVTFTGRTDLAASLEADGVTFIDIPATGRLRLVRRLHEVIGDIQPDLVHTTLIDADIVGRAAAAGRRTPVVSSLVNLNHGTEYFRGERSISRSKRVAAWAADAATARLVVRFHALTEHVAATMGKRLGIPRSRVDVIPRGRDPAVLGRRSDGRRLVARDQLGVGDRPLVIAAARHEYQKGLDVLLRACPQVLSELPDTTFLIGGRDGAASDNLRELHDSLDLGDQVRFLGQREDVAELMCAADLWCVPSRWEGLGSILIEAMALEVPVVASDIPPIREIAGEPAGFDLITPDDPVALADAIVKALRSPSDLAGAVESARRRFVRYYTAERVADSMMQFYERAYTGSRLT